MSTASRAGTPDRPRLRLLGKGGGRVWRSASTPPEKIDDDPFRHLTSMPPLPPLPLGRVGQRFEYTHANRSTGHVAGELDEFDRLDDLGDLDLELGIRPHFESVAFAEYRPAVPLPTSSFESPVGTLPSLPSSASLPPSLPSLPPLEPIHPISTDSALASPTTPTLPESRAHTPVPPRTRTRPPDLRVNTTPHAELQIRTSLPAPRRSALGIVPPFLRGARPRTPPPSPLTPRSFSFGPSRTDEKPPKNNGKEKAKTGKDKAKDRPSRAPRPFTPAARSRSRSTSTSTSPSTSRAPPEPLPPPPPRNSSLLAYDNLSERVDFTGEPVDWSRSNASTVSDRAANGRDGDGGDDADAEVDSEGAADLEPGPESPISPLPPRSRKQAQAHNRSLSGKVRSLFVALMNLRMRELPDAPVFTDGAPLRPHRSPSTASFLVTSASNTQGVTPRSRASSAATMTMTHCRVSGHSGESHSASTESALSALSSRPSSGPSLPSRQSGLSSLSRLSGDSVGRTPSRLSHRSRSTSARGDTLHSEYALPDWPPLSAPSVPVSRHERRPTELVSHFSDTSSSSNDSDEHHHTRNSHAWGVPERVRAPLRALSHRAHAHAQHLALGHERTHSADRPVDALPYVRPLTPRARASPSPTTVPGLSPTPTPPPLVFPPNGFPPLPPLPAHAPAPRRLPRFSHARSHSANTRELQHHFEDESRRGASLDL